jgi:DNA polymerase
VTDALETLHLEVRECTLCPLHHGRLRAVPGAGNPRAEILIIGEAPGQKEDEQGLPFVGAAGQLLNDLLAGIGVAREDTYISNIVKCRPPQNRDPLPNEVEACSDYLRRQVDIIDPAVILILGRHALQRLLPGTDGISRVHGRLVERDGRAYVPLYHPAAALYNNFLVDTLRQDFGKVRGYLDSIEARRTAAPAPATEPEPKEQLSLF